MVLTDHLKDYIESQWIHGIGAEALTVAFNSRRTNNEAEVTNRYILNCSEKTTKYVLYCFFLSRYINRKLRTAHPNIYTWALAMSEILDKSATELSSLRSGRPVRRETKNAFAEKNVKLQVLQRKVSSGSKDSVVFLAEAATICKGYHLWLARNMQSHDRDILVPEVHSQEQHEEEEEMPTQDTGFDASQPPPLRPLTSRLPQVVQEPLQAAPASPALTRSRAAQRRQASLNHEEQLPTQPFSSSTPQNHEERQHQTQEGNRIEDELQRDCRVCLLRPKSAALLPCGHADLCRDCAVVFVNATCPSCRTPVTSMLRLYNQM